MKRALMNTTLAALTFCSALAIFNGCTTDTTDSANSVNTINGGSGGITGAAGTAGIGGYGGDYYAGYAGTAGYVGDAGAAGTAGTGGTSAGSARIRFAHLSPDVQEIDICFRSSGAADWSPTNAIGPFFKASGTPDDFYFPAVSIYADIDAGQWDFRFVPHGAADCLTAFSASFADQTAQIAAYGSYTLTLEGEQASILRFAIYPDQTTPLAGKVGYQVINALTETGPLDFGLTDVTDPNNQVFYPIVENVQALGADGQTNSASPYPNAVPTAIKTGDATVVLGTAPAVESLASDLYTVFVIGTKPADVTPALRPSLIFCRNDNTNKIDVNTTGSLIATKSCCYGDGQQDCNMQ